MPSADTTTTTTLATNLRRLGFNRTADDLNDLIAQAARKRSSATVLLEHIVAAELEDKQRRSVESRLTRARLGRSKPFADWDWQWPTALDRPTLERILTLDFLARGENVILVGAQGLGKTMLAKNIAHQAILAGHTALFTTAADLLLNLNGQETARALERRLRHYTRPALLVVDEVGYLAYDARAADLLFQLVSRRYEHRSLLITTNLPFKRWDTVFPNASCAVALIDRLTHHVEILLLEGRSYRRREAEISQQERNPNDRTVTTRRNHRDPHVVNETGRYLCRNDQFLALGNILVTVLGGVLAELGQHRGTALLEGVGDVLQEDQAEHDVLVLGGVHGAAQRVGHRPQLGLMAGRGPAVRFRLRAALLLLSGSSSRHAPGDPPSQESDSRLKSSHSLQSAADPPVARRRADRSGAGSPESWPNRARHGLRDGRQAPCPAAGRGSGSAAPRDFSGH